MDHVTLALAKKYSDSQRIGYAEPGKVFTYDGGEDAEFEEVGGELLVKLSDGVFDLNKVKKIKCMLRNNGQILEYSRDELTLSGLGDGITCLEATYSNHTLPAIFASTAGGLYGFVSQQVGYLSYVEFAETIHPIDQKYLPDTVATKADIFGAMEASY